jgi:hypothetical protein
MRADSWLAGPEKVAGINGRAVIAVNGMRERGVASGNNLSEATGHVRKRRTCASKNIEIEHQDWPSE